MRYLKREKIADVLLLLLLFSTFIIEEDRASLFFLCFGFILFLALNYRADILSPFFYLFPSSLYIIINTYSIYKENVTGYLLFFSCVFLGMLSMSLALRYSYGIERTYKSSVKNATFFYQLFFISVTISFVNIIAQAWDFYPIFFKGSHFVANAVCSAIILGALLAISVKKIKYALLLSLYYLSVLVISNSYANDISRFSFFCFIIYLFFCFHFGLNWKSKKIYLFILVFYIIYSFLIVRNNLNIEEYGGDVRVIRNAIDMLTTVNSFEYEYFMPFFNGFFIIIPNEFWPFSFSKPIAYNVSAWFIEHVMGINPLSYPWGIGVTLFAASYLYGGFIGIIIIFSLIGCFLGKLSKLVKNPFWAGFLLSFLIKLPFAVYRMDETFLFGAVIPMLLVLYSFVLLFKDKIDRSFE